ncbi:Hsp33 family molecular chaperone HslO [Xanthomonas perforans]|uniref:Hsp33 family molecular chaperone HslO n=1 Tax=Xanthomonas euvesicatoria TaxID=456327 RepID=A0AAX4FG91_XANEU|nr:MULTISPECIES: Hsp33 family molecular chaperone HslO [Xanthomonas]MBO9856696.1 Hsp33 family molecular chaperone HslO [Xanthomonas sp. A1809]MBV6860832.1 Hsp33 family molecular chaperone HslO [Xanthomonas campestris pv. blepharidis]MBV6867076.1 Hsp33 family molecular chaperone HslO [Xanthomonas campestris pv. coriandri]MBV6886242.1 Hsp33 family molecular chaperone HslO [Xanthomonas campestris pv. spermacoces]MCC8912912.1 Hsp33 family molecular chaperone HslO [Xanthomonas euvesicatoria]
MTDHDQLSRFLLPAAGVRGVHVRLTKAWHDIQGAAAYPPAARQLLGEAAVAAALFTGHTKVDGRLSVQLRGNDILRTLFAECTAAGTLRGIVQLAEDADAPTDLRELGEAALLAITIENPGLDPREPQRYQSLVGMQAPDLAEAFETYFQQSEQLPTRLLLAAGPDQAAGLLLQKLPGDEGDNDGWTRIGALFDTLGAPELLSVAGQDLLHRLFHEEAPQLLGSKPLSFGCSCSRERVASMLQSLGEEEARAAAEATGEVEVRCEFCGREYHFPLTALDVLFNAAQPSQEAPERLQ